MSADAVMQAGSHMMTTVDTIGRLSRALHDQPDSARYRRLAETCPSSAVMLALIRIVEGISDHFEGELSFDELIAIGSEHAKDSAVRAVAAYLDAEERGLEPDDPFRRFR